MGRGHSAPGQEGRGLEQSWTLQPTACSGTPGTPQVSFRNVTKAFLSAS